MDTVLTPTSWRAPCQSSLELLPSVTPHDTANIPSSDKAALSPPPFFVLCIYMNACTFDSEVSGITQLAALRASQAEASAKEAAASAATATKEAARKYGAAAVIDAERLYEAGKQKSAHWAESAKASVVGTAGGPPPVDQA